MIKVNKETIIWFLDKKETIIIKKNKKFSIINKEYPHHYYDLYLERNEIVYINNQTYDTFNIISEELCELVKRRMIKQELLK
jgi:hypothetical protein